VSDLSLPITVLPHVFDRQRERFVEQRDRETIRQEIVCALLGRRWSDRKPDWVRGESASRDVLYCWPPTADRVYVVDAGRRITVLTVLQVNPDSVFRVLLGMGWG
jgi:hypothetical protein